nr:MAG TPA: hypothetical protein [Caudoviricetes sp.]
MPYVLVNGHSKHVFLCVPTLIQTHFMIKKTTYSVAYSKSVKMKCFRRVYYQSILSVILRHRIYIYLKHFNLSY